MNAKNIFEVYSFNASSMFSLIKGIIWIVGFVVVAGFVLDYFGYDINQQYFSQSKKACLEEVKECQKEFIHQGIDNTQCSFECVNPRLIIKKR